MDKDNTEFKKIQENSKYYIRIHLEDQTKENFNISFTTKGDDIVIANVLTEFIRQSPSVMKDTISGVFSAAYLHYTMFKNNEKRTLNLIKSELIKRVEENPLPLAAKRGNHSFMLEVTADSNDDDESGTIAAKITRDQGILYALLLYTALKNDKFYKILKLASDDTPSVGDKSKIAQLSKIAKLLDNLKSMDNEHDDCDCPNCVERRKEAKLIQKSEANLNAALDIIDGTYIDPEDKE